MRIGNLVRMGGGTLVAVLCLGGIIVGWQVNSVRMGGEIQLRSKQVADLVADILPPPEYIIEPYLEASLIALDPAKASARTSYIADLHRQYDERQRLWRGADLPQHLKQQIGSAVDAPAQAFWNVLETSFLPAARAGNVEAVRGAYRQLQDAYAKHRAAIDRLVTSATAYQREVEAQAGATVWTMVLTLSALGAVVLSIVGAAVAYLIRRVINPMAQLSQLTTAMAGGAAPQVPYRDRNDELGDIARALQSFGEAAEARQAADARNLEEQRIVNDALGERLAALRHGDLTRTINTDFPAAYEPLRVNFNEAVCALRGMVQSVSTSAGTIDRGAIEIAAAADDLARRTEASAANLEETTAALQQINGLLASGLQAAGETLARAEQATLAASSGRATGAEAAQTMDRVAQSAEDIGSVIESLDKIAFQTRVLAMNAAVEAGRAGEAGSGFAVVADLVSALAQRAEEEARRVRELITATREDIGIAAGAVHRTDSSLAAIADDVDMLHDLLTRLQGDVKQQARAMSEVATAMTQLDVTTQQNAAMVEQASAATRTLSAEVSVLSSHAAAFKFERRQRDIPVAHERRGERRRPPVAQEARQPAVH